MSIPRRCRVTVDIFLQMLPVCLNCHFESPRSALAANRFQTQAGVPAYQKALNLNVTKVYVFAVDHALKLVF